MLSFIKFLNYLKKNPNYLSDIQQESLHKLLFCNPNDRYVDSKLFSKILGIRKSFAKEILVTLAKETALELKVRCETCDFDNNFSSNKICEACGIPLEISEDTLFVKVEGVLSNEKKQQDNEETVREEQLSQMIALWNKNKYIIYMLVDVSNSEAIQNNNNENYKRYLDCLREMIRKDCFSVLKGNYLCFGEIGDCFKLGFSNTDDIYPFIKELAKTHFDNYKKGVYPKSVEGLAPYPCLKVSAQLLELDNTQKPENILFKTLNGSLDFNSDILTKLFRLDGKLRLDYDKVFTNDNKLCVWIFDKLADKICLQGGKVHIDAKKHPEISSEADVIAITFPNGEPVISSNPKEFLVENDSEYNDFWAKFAKNAKEVMQ